MKIKKVCTNKITSIKRDTETKTQLANWNRLTKKKRKAIKKVWP